ncbi:MAG: hypothetical protein RIF33_22980 [Cyclobacteriaceae bacterium]
MVFLLIGLLITCLILGVLGWIVWISSRLGYLKIGIGIVSTISAVLLFTTISFIYEDAFFFKSDARSTLKEHNIVLSDDFEFKRKSITGIMDHVLQFDILISPRDKDNLIQQLSTSSFRLIVDIDMYDIRSQVPQTILSDTTLYASFEDERFWNLQYCKVLANGYVQKWDVIQVSKKGNKLSLLRIQ